MAPPSSGSQLVQMLETMQFLRAFEEKVSELYATAQIAGLLHLGIGQEAIATGVASQLGDDDVVFAGHRAHGHALARGVDPESLIAELAGREGGCCRGVGGSMHIAAPDVGFVTATGIVGQNIPLALGAAWALTLDASDAVAVAVFGDGAGQSGALHESLNIASLWQLPVIFVCENNGYAEFTPITAHTRVRALARYADVYDIPSSTIDGNDVEKVAATIGTAVRRARQGEGPSFVEAVTFRFRGHYEGDPGRYRDRGEVAEWRRRDPVARAVKSATTANLVDIATADEMGARARRRAEEAAARALALPPASGWGRSEERHRGIR